METRARFRIAIKAIVFGVLTGAFIFACFTAPVEKMLKSFLVWIDTKLGPWGPVVLALAYVPLTVVGVPAAILTLGGGYMFGLPIGFIADSVGSTTGALAAFFVGRLVGREYVISKLKDYPKLESITLAIQRSGFKIVLLLRLAPLVPFNALNYLLSVTPIGLGEYMLASWLGMVPITLLMVYIGTTIKDLSGVTHSWREITSIHWILLPTSLVATVVLMIWVTQVVKGAINEAEENDCTDDSWYISVDPESVNETYWYRLRQAFLIKKDPTVNKT